jgi:hypothetical protein
MKLLERVRVPKLGDNPEDRSTGCSPPALRGALAERGAGGVAGMKKGRAAALRRWEPLILAFFEAEA